MVFDFLLGLVLGVTLTCIITTCTRGQARAMYEKEPEGPKVSPKVVKQVNEVWLSPGGGPNSIHHQIVGA